MDWDSPRQVEKVLTSHDITYRYFNRLGLDEQVAADTCIEMFIQRINCLGVS